LSDRFELTDTDELIEHKKGQKPMYTVSLKQDTGWSCAVICARVMVMIVLRMNHSMDSRIYDSMDRQVYYLVQLLTLYAVMLALKP
jgi:hypothetical protein